DLDDRLVGLDLEEHLALLDGVAFLLEPRDELAGLLRHLERRHHYAGCHRSPGYVRATVTSGRLTGPYRAAPASARAAAAIICFTSGLGDGASTSRTVGSSPLTVTNGAPATSSCSAGNRVITS